MTFDRFGRPLEELPPAEVDLLRTCTAHALPDPARSVRRDLEVIELSALTGEGLDDWLAWLARLRAPRQELNRA